MTYIENVFVCVAAPLLVAALCMGKPYLRFFLFAFAGMGACLAAAYVNTFFAALYGATAFNATAEIAPVVEEVIKLLPLLFYLLVFEPEPEQIRPAGMILSYPVITSGEYGHQESFKNLLGERYEELKDMLSLEKQVSPDTPRTFLWHTMEDATVPMENSLLFLQALRHNGVPAEYHLFPYGKHGVGLGNSLTAGEDGSGFAPCADCWSALAAKWLLREFPWWTPGREFR